jgi:hypothetical protein
VTVASLGIQVHGGAGYIEQTGAAQHLRDARVFAIYEGTNGIQAIDLVRRKLKLGDGAAVRSLIGEFAAIAARAGGSNRPELGETGPRIGDAVADLDAATEFMIASLGAGRIEVALAGATAYLRLFGLAAGGALLAKGALAEAGGEPFLALARFFAERMAGETAGLLRTVTTGAAALELGAHSLLN